MIQKNFDPSTSLSWFRKLDQHPESEIQALAAAFCARIASAFGMQPPTIHWFEDAEYAVARDTWLRSEARGVNEATDPLAQPCAYFRWTGRPGVGFAGYAHWESSTAIMVNIGCMGEKLLQIVAEECFHLYQDMSHGSGWRRRTDTQLVEDEASAFVRGQAGEIRSFLQEWGSDGKANS